VPPGDDGADLVAGYIARWRPSSVSPPAAAFARQVVRAACQGGRERAKNLLWAAARLAGYAVPLGLDPVPEVLLHPSVIERFARCAPGLSGVARRTLRTNLRFLARQVVPQLAPADAPLPREHAKAPYSPAEIAGYLALADAQPTLSRRMRASGLICLGAGAGLIRADLRDVHGTDVTCRSGGVIVAVSGGARPRAVPVLARYHDRLLAAAASAGTGLICGGTDPGRRNITTPLIRSLAGGTGLPRLDTSRLRATWLADVADLPVRPPRSWQRPGSPAPSGSATCSPAWNPPESRTRSGCSGRPGRHDPAARPGGDHRPLRRRAADRGATAHRGAPPAAADRTLLAGMLIVLADHRPAHLTRVHQALTTQPEADQRRLGVVADWKHGPHQLTYRQTERTFGLVADALAKDVPDGLPSDTLTAICNDLLEASIPDEHKHASAALAVDWTDVETFSRPPSRGTSDCADPEASWGHRSGGGPGQDSELFFG
jgi:hypothetical protein